MRKILFFLDIFRKKFSWSNPRDLLKRTRVKLLLASNSPSTNEKKKEIKKVPYASTVGSLMYLMIYTRPNVVVGASLVNCYMANSEKNLWGW